MTDIENKVKLYELEKRIYQLEEKMTDIENKVDLYELERNIDQLEEKIKKIEVIESDKDN